MLYLLWAIANVSLFIFLLLGGIKAVKYIRQKFGFFSALLIVLGFLSFIGAPFREGNTANQPMPGWNFNPIENTQLYSRKLTIITLERHLVSKYELQIYSGINKQDQLTIPINANSNTLGLVAGTKWKPTYIRITPTEEKNKFEYEVEGDEDWKLLGVIIFSHSKHFSGVIELK